MRWPSPRDRIGLGRKQSKVSGTAKPANELPANGERTGNFTGQEPLTGPAAQPPGDHEQVNFELSCGSRLPRSLERWIPPADGSKDVLGLSPKAIGLRQRGPLNWSCSN